MGFKTKLFVLVFIIGIASVTGFIVFNVGFESSEPDSSETRISDWEDLDTIREHPDKSYILTSDLDSESDGYDEFGSDWEPITEFTGDLDGQGYSISGIVIDQHKSVEPETTEENGVEPVSRVDTEEYIGAAVIGTNTGVIQNVSFTDIQVSGDSKTAGVTIENNGEIDTVRVTGSIEGTRFVGGITAHNDGSITNTVSTASISANRYVGGLVGSNSSEVTYSYYNGTLEGQGTVGGIAGAYIDGEISQTYATGDIQLNSSSNTGGIVGVMTDSNSVNASYHDISNSNTIGTALTTSEMKGGENKLDNLNKLEWVFNEDKYPELRE